VGPDALIFNSTTAYVNVANSGSLDNVYTAGMTVSAWIKPISAGGGGRGRIIDKDSAGGPGGWFFCMFTNSTVQFTGDEFATTAAYRVSAGSIALNTWQHVVATWDGSTSGANVHLYINGVLADSSTTQNGVGAATGDVGTTFAIGNRTSDVARGFDGAIDDVRVYNRILSAAEIQALADSTPPSAPSGLATTAASSSQINLNWTASTDNVGVTGYLIERCQGTACSAFTQVATAVGTTYSNTGLTASTNYSYRVRATDANSNLGSYSNVSSVSTSAAGDTQAPTAPTALAATATSSTQINLNWTASTDNVGVTGYRVELCQGASCTAFAQVGTPTTSNYSSTGLTAATAYSFRVRATDAAGNLSAYSSTASSSTQPGTDTQAPTAPTAPAASTGSASQINLTWTAATDNVGVTGYLIERCSGASCATFAQVGSITSVTTYNDPSLTASTSYSYRIRAKDAANNLGPYSSVVSATTSGVGGNANSVTYTYDEVGRLKSAIYDTGTTIAYGLDAAGNRTLVSTGLDARPAAPTSLALTGSSPINVSIQWALSTSSGVTAQQVFRSTGGGAPTPIGGALSATTSTFTDTAVTPSTAYSYTVIAFLGPIDSLPSGALTVTTPAIGPPTVPSGLVATPVSFSQVNLTWNMSTDNGPAQPGLQGYHVYREGTLLSSPTATNYNDTSALSGTSYHYSVSAYDTAGRESARSPLVPATTFYEITDTNGNVVSAAASLYSVNTICPQQNCSTILLQTFGNSGSAASIAHWPASCPTATTIVGSGYLAASGCSIQAPANVYFYPILPTVPGNFTATVNSYSQITLNWAGSTDVGGPGLKGYTILRNGTALPLLGPTATSLVDSPIASNTLYTYTISAVDTSNVPSGTATASASTPAITPPPDPVNLTGVAVSSSQINLTWSVPAYIGGAGIKNYNVTRNGATLVPPSVAPLPAVVTLSDTGLALGTTYVYVVTTQDNVNQVSHAATVSVSTNGDTTPPSAPGTITMSNIVWNGATANWVNATDNVGVASYEYQITGAGQPNNGVWTNVGNSLTTGIAGLAAGGSTYTIAVRAKDAAGNMGPSSTASFTTAFITDSPTVTVTNIPPGICCVSAGFGPNFGGSMNPATTTNGYTYYELDDRYSPPKSGGGFLQATFSVTGFSADPGQAWLTSVCGNMGATATYAYGSGFATWSWTQNPFGIADGTFVCNIVHK
jgi:fibronectin type 3 domain-containing protein